MGWLFDGLISWLVSKIGGTLDILSKMFSSAIGCSLDTFDSVFPYASTVENIILGVGLSLLFLILIFQLFRTLWGPLADNTVEHPVVLLLRCIAFFPIVFFSKSIVQYVLYIASVPYTMLQDSSADVINQSLYSQMSQMMNEYTKSITTQVIDGSVGNILLIIFIVLIGWNYLKLVIEIAERYVVIGIIAYTAPIAAATGGSKATGNIFKGWCRLVGSQTFLMIMNIWFLKLISSGLTSISTYKGSFITWALLVIAMEKGAQAMDSYLRSIVGNVAITGNGILDDMAAVAGSLKGLASSFSGGHSGSVGTIAESVATAGTGAAAASIIGRKFAASSFAADAVADGGRRQSVGGGIAAEVATGFAPSIARGIAGKAFNSSLNNDGNFATKTISRVAHGNGSKDYGTIADSKSSAIGSKSFAHYFKGGGYSADQLNCAYIGNGEASARIGGDQTVKYFDAQKFRAPKAGSYMVENASDGSRWYKQSFNTDGKAPAKPERL